MSSIRVILYGILFCVLLLTAQVGLLVFLTLRESIAISTFYEMYEENNREDSVPEFEWTDTIV